MSTVYRFATCFSLFSGLFAACVYAQTAPIAPDTLTFTNGERLTGHLVRATGGSVIFHSDTLGDITFDWSKVQELHSARTFVVVPKNTKIDRKVNPSSFPRGPIAVANQHIEVGAQSVAIGDAGYVVEESEFQAALRDHNNLFHDWTGAVTGGASLVEATQTSSTFTGGVNLIRAIPTESWLAPRDRTTVDFAASYGKLTQPGTPMVKTDLFHLDVERDEYFRSTVYGFGQAAFDHNFSQGLDLQQGYGGGIGWTLVNTATQKLDLKASVRYISQEFRSPTPSQSLIGSNFAQTYQRKLPRGILFTEALSVTPAWNNANAYSAEGNAGLAMPVYKRLSLSLQTLDTFLNDPPPGFKKNSFQFTAGVTYALR